MNENHKTKPDIEEWKATLRRLEEWSGNQPPLSPEECLDILTDPNLTESEAKETMLKSVTGLLVKTATWGANHSKYGYCESLSIVTEITTPALDTYDPLKGFRLTTYLSPYLAKARMRLQENPHNTPSHINDWNRRVDYVDGMKDESGEGIENKEEYLYRNRLEGASNALSSPSTHSTYGTRGFVRDVLSALEGEPYADAYVLYKTGRIDLKEAMSICKVSRQWLITCFDRYSKHLRRYFTTG